MKYLTLVAAVLLLILGHSFKARRWKRLISTYEDVSLIRLLQILATGQTINMVIPFRIGDIWRVYSLGKKDLKNGYVLSLATVIADLFIDTVTVGLAFITLYLLGIHKDEIAATSLHYGIISLVLIVAIILIVWQKKRIKKLIQWFAGIFNATIERRILYATYTLFASVKDNLNKEKIPDLFIDTVLLWSSYFVSYDLFAIFMQQMGYDLTLTSVFKTIFSVTGRSLLIECIKRGAALNNGLLWFLVYLALPLIIINIIATIKLKSFGVQNAVTYRKILPQLNRSERLAFLEVYFNDENRKYFDSYLEINKNVSVIQDLSAGSNATTILCLDKNTTFFRKYAFGADGEKLWDQVLWLEKYKDELPVTRILNAVHEEGYCYYDMQYLTSAVGFFKYIHTSLPDDSWKILNAVLDTLSDKLYKPSLHDGVPEKLKEYIDSKVIKNIGICDKWGHGDRYRDFYEAPTIIINGKEYNNLSYYKDFLSAEKLLKIFGHDKYAITHGDLTIENIVCMQGSTKGWYLIDPNSGCLHETPFLDYAKLLQSLHGKYEFLMMVKDVSFSENHVEFLFTGSNAYIEIYERYKKYLFEKFSREQVQSIYFHEIIHWLRLMPYKIRKNPDLAVVFYAGMLIVLADVEKEFGYEKL